MERRRFVKPLQRRVVNPLARTLVRRGLIGGTAILETIGRRSGEPRETPVSNGLDGDTFWIVAEYGRRASYVRNIEANPHVRVCVRGRCREGSAHVVAGDDVRARLRTLPRLNALAVRTVGDDLLTIRVDLNPRPSGQVV